MSGDRHGTRKIARLLGIIVSALFAAFGVAGYQRSEDPLQLVVFLALAGFSYLIIIYLFKGVDRLLDTVDDRPDNNQ